MPRSIPAGSLSDQAGEVDSVNDGGVVIVVPCFNESTTIASMVERLVEAVADDPDTKILLVDDGSTDPTVGILRRLSELHESVDFLSFTRNFGKEAAMFAGLESAADTGSAVLFMDADGQHPPEVAATMIRHYRTGARHIVAQRDRADETRPRRLVARLAYRVLSASTRVAFVNGQGDFRLLSPQLTAALASMPERNRFSKGLYAWLGTPDEIIDFDTPMTNDRRKSTWNLRALLDYAIDGLTGFNSRPLRLVLAVGIASAVVSIIYGIIAVGLAIQRGVDVPGYLTTIIAVMVLGSLQLISLGVIGEYVGRILVEVKGRPSYLIGERSDRSLIPERSREDLAQGAIERRGERAAS